MRIALATHLVIFGLLRQILSEKRPNIVLFVADDLGIGDVGCYGNTTLRTPNIDKLAREGARMTQHLSTASMCTPSRAAFLTGRYQARSGMATREGIRVTYWLASTSGLPAEEVTFAELAKDAGYKTILLGKWHLGEHSSPWSRDYKKHPLNQGYDQYYGAPLGIYKDFGNEGDSTFGSGAPHLFTALYVAMSTVGLSVYIMKRKGLFGVKTSIVLFLVTFCPLLYIYIITAHFKELNSLLLRNKTIAEQPIRLAGLTGRLVNEAVEFLQKRSKDREPFLLHMSWLHVHTFLDPSKKFKGQTKHGRYGDCVEEMDWGTGKILEALEKYGFADNTLVYFTSDHGAHVEETGTRGQIDGGSNGIYKGGKSHGTFDGGIRVPGILKWPGEIQPGTVVPEMTSQLDIFPLISIATGTKIPNNRTTDGKNILPLIQGTEQVSPHQFLFHYCTDEIHAVRYKPRTGSKTWKLAFKEPDYLPNATRCHFACSCRHARVLDPPKLYDLTSDPEENHPIRSDLDLETKLITDKIYSALVDHIRSIQPVESQFSLKRILWLPWLQNCCNFPSCSCIDEKYGDPEKHMEL